VRRYLGLQVKKRLIGYQFSIPVARVHPSLDMFLDWRRFGPWYAWIFPHGRYINVGCICDPHLIDHRKVKGRFLEWLKEKHIDPGDARLESHPIAYDYRGVRFGNVFLAGEAAGLASGFTGEGIYQSLVSGREIARMILDPAHDNGQMDQLLRYNLTLQRILNILRWSGPLKGLLHELLVILINTDRIRERINARFSSR
jgi:flavin-dependent dehydrogenase